MSVIAIVGDRNPDNPTHRATEAALGASAQWVPTIDVEPDRLGEFDGLLISPGTPYASMEGALSAIRYARERHVPLLGTCGGFQHVVLELARDVLGIANADHAETSPDADELAIVPLACSLAGQRDAVAIEPGTLAAELYGVDESVEPFFCSYGLNPQYRSALERAGVRFSGFDRDGEPRILELPGHPFFLATLYVPQVDSTRAAPHPVVAGFVEACRVSRAPTPTA